MQKFFTQSLLIAYLFAALLPFFAAPDVPEGAIFICTPDGAKIIDPATGKEQRIVHQGHQCCCTVSAGKDLALSLQNSLPSGAIHITGKTLLPINEYFSNSDANTSPHPRAPPALLFS